MMEISKGLQLEIQSVQSKLNNAIRDHQICVGKLKDEPNNPDILDKIQEIELHIVSLGRCQKQVVQRLRKEVDDYKAVNANDVKVSVASLLGLNNNNHITTNNEPRNKSVSEVCVVVSNGHDNARHAAAKEHYENIVRNGDVSARLCDPLKKSRSISVETLSADDEEVIEVSVENNRRAIVRQMSEEPLEERRIKCNEQLSFLEVLGLTTTLRCTELQNRRAERKRRSTANPQFVYSSFDMPTKRKRHNYLQSAGNNVPQTRQTTARLNGPSPPPICNKSTNAIVPPKSTSPPTRAISKSLIPTQKATTRPNILRNMSESRVFPNKTSRSENESGHAPSTTCTTTTTTKTSQSTGSKAVHFPGLPSGLTIERIENDTAVCINCRNPGTLTNCDNCEANYHVSCHSISPPPPRLCPKCALKTSDTISTIKKNDELAAASYAPGVAGKAGEDPEIDKASRGFYKIGTNARQQIVGTSCCINKLSGSTFLIPIAPNAVAAGSVAVPKSTGIAGGVVGTAPRLESEPKDSARVQSAVGKLSYTTTIVLNNHLSRSSVTYVPTSADSLGGGLSYAYKLPIYESQKSQNYVERRNEAGEYGEARSSRDDSSRRDQKGKFYGTCAIEGNRDDTRKRCFEATTLKEPKQQQRELGKLTGRLAESITRGWKRSSNRAVPGLTRIVQSNDNRRNQRSVPTDHANLDNVDELRDRAGVDGATVARGERHDRARSVNGGQSSIVEDKSRGCESRGADEPRDRDDKDKRVEIEREIVTRETESLVARDDNDGHQPNSVPDKFHLLLAGYNEPDNHADRPEQSKLRQGAPSSGEIGNENERGNDDDDDDDAEHGDRDQRQFERPIIGPEPRKVIPSAEHVKLEEAHLSAPPRAKLTGKNGTGEEIAGTSTILNNRLLPSRRRTTEDRVSREIFEAARLERHPMPRILMRSERKSLDSRESRLSPITVRRNLVDFLPLLASGGNAEIDVIDARVESSNTVGRSGIVAKETTGPSDGKNGDTPNGVGETNEEIESGDNLEIDEETEDNEEDVEDEEDQDCPIVDEDIREGAIEELRISNVSPESIQVLEQFETAMMQAENGDKTANI